MSENNRPASQQPSRFGTLESGQPAPRRQVQGGRPRQTRPAAGGSALPSGFWPMAVVGLAMVLIGALLQCLMPDGFPLKTGATKAARAVAPIQEIRGEGPVRLNEIMSANGGTLVDEAGNTPDWVEVANIGSRPVNLEGYILSKKVKAGNVFVFPEVILQPGECAVVYADSTYQSEADKELHAPFRLSSNGDVMMLFNTADVAVDTVNIPALGENVAYVRTDRNAWQTSDRATPGMLNTEDNYRAMTSVVETSAVSLSEVVASNTQYALDENGVPQDYVILSNASGEAVDISGWFISDDPLLPRQWRFPAGTVIPGNGTLLVHCSGTSRTEDPAHLHASFRLSSEGETITLSNASGQRVDSVTYDLLKTDSAWIRGGDGSWSAGAPTAK